MYFFILIASIDIGMELFHLLIRIYIFANCRLILEKSTHTCILNV